MEQGSSIAAVKLGEEMIEHFVIGTGVIKSTEAEAKIGRILAIRELHSKQDPIAQRRNFELTNVGKLSGAVGGVGGLPNGMFVASANAFVHAFGLKKGNSGSALPRGTDTVPSGSVPEMDGGFRLLDTWGGGFVSQTVVTDGTKVLVGDLYKSVVLLEFDLEHLELAVKARDFSAMSVRPIGAISEREFVAADSEFNMFTVQYDSPTSPGPDGKSDRPNQDAHREEHGVHVDDEVGSDEDDEQDDEQVTPISSPGPFGGDDEILQQVGAFYLGENVNHFRRGKQVSLPATTPLRFYTVTPANLMKTVHIVGSLVPRFIESSLIGETKLIFVTSTGGIGLIAKIHSKKKTKQLARFQSDLSKISTSVGNLAHSA
jgi:DNA damage-binding protein 1